MQRVGELGVAIAGMANDIEDTQAALAQDEKFKKELDEGCATKADEWEEVKKLRSEELLALAETIKVLNDDDALEMFKKTLPSAGASSFVQMGATAASMRARALAALRQAQQQAGSADRAQLDLLALAMHGKAAGFEKVITLIDSMVETLKKEQLDDDHKKEYCVGQFDTADDKKKALERSVADEEAAIAAAEEGLATVKEEIAALEAGIKDLDKQVAEATEQRKEESEEYKALEASDTAAKELLGFAKNRLNKFYNPKLYKPPAKEELSAEDRIVENMGGASLVQAAPGPPPEAPGPFKKKTEESQGVIAMIDLFIKDLDKEMLESKVSEKDPQEDYEALMKESAEKRAQDSKAVTDKSAALADSEDQLQAEQDKKAGSEEQLKSTKFYLMQLHNDCDWLIKYYDMRKTARTTEIESLESAKAVLNGADFSLVQTGRVARAHVFLGPRL